MNFTYLKFYAVILCVVFAELLNGGTALCQHTFSLKQLDSRQGLSNSSVTNLFRDRNGLLWVSTWDGLNVYDGNSFHVFNYSGYQVPTSIGNNVVKQVREDINGKTWIATMEGISSYNKSTGKFHHYFYQLKRQRSIGGNEFSIATDRTGNVFCLSKAKGLFGYDHLHDQFKRVGVPDGQPLAKIKFDKQGRLWGLGRNGVLYVYDYTSGKLWLQKKYVFPSQVKIFFQFKQKIYFITGDRHFFQVDEDLQLHMRSRLPHDVKAMTIYKGNYLIAWTAGGFGVLDSAFQRSDFLHVQRISLQSSKITAMLADKDGIIWCATDGNGIIEISPQRPLFTLVSGKASGGNAQLKQVRSFCEVGSDLWVGTKGNGINVLKNFTLNKEGRYESSVRYPNMLNNNSVYTLLHGNDKLIYIGTDGRGLLLYDQKKQHFVQWKEIENTDKYPSFRSVFAIAQDDDNSVWLGTNGNGLIHLRVITEKDGGYRLESFKQYLYDGTNKGPGNDIINCIQKGRDHRLWFGCRFGGLSVLNKKTGLFRTFRAFSYEGSLSHNDVLSLDLDQKGGLWIGTSYGLNRIAEKEATGDKPIFTKLSVNDGLPNNTVHAIIDDGAGYEWVSTNKGLARINQITLQVDRFQDHDELRSNEFSDGASWKDKNGNLLFGGLFGFNVLIANQVAGRNKPATLLLTDLQLGNETLNENSLVMLRPGQKRAPKFSLQRGDDNFEVNLKPIVFESSISGDYAYQLTGFDNGWRYAKDNGKIKYSNLPPGEYALRVKWFGTENGSSTTATAFIIEVKPFVWKSLPAYILYLIVVASIIYLWIRYRQKKDEFANRLEMERLLRHKEDELHQRQIGFFTNVAHELRTPVTLINGSVERFFHKGTEQSNCVKEQRFLSIVHQQSSRLTYLVNQLLDFRKLEAGYLKCHPGMLEISMLLNGIAELFIPMSEQKNINYHIDISSDIVGWTDQDKLEKIVFNLLSNAFKHSAERQDVIFHVNSDATMSTVEIVVSNTGCNLSEDDLKQVFNLFFDRKSKASDQFTSGIGLAFTRELVGLLNGTLDADLKDGVIEFVVRLPLLTRDYDTSDEKETQPSSSSYLMRSITAGSREETVNVKESNKRSLIANLENSTSQAVLVVDDEPSIRYLLKDILEEFFIVYEAETGRQAIELLQVVSVDLIISDVMMPDINGIELCQKVKNTPDTCHLPFIMLSAKGEIDQQTEGYDAGADAYIPKPFDTQYMIVRVKKLLEYRTRLHAIFTKENKETTIADKNLSGDDRIFLKKLVELIEAHIEDTTLDASFLETQMALSKMQLYRKMKTLSNMTPLEFIKHMRLQKSIKLLETTSLSVNEVFYQSGFNNQSHFFREFKKRFNCSPSEYRSQHRIHI